MKLNLFLCIVAGLLILDGVYAKTDLKLNDSLKRQLRKGASRSSSGSSYSGGRSSYYTPSSYSSYTKPSYTKPSYSSSSTSSYKKTTTTTKSTSYNYYTGSFSGGRSYGVLYAYYLPLNYYTTIGYYSPLYL